MAQESPILALLSVDKEKSDHRENLFSKCEISHFPLLVTDLTGHESLLQCLGRTGYT